MSRAPKDNLPLDGKVCVPAPERVGVYRGYHCHDFQLCAVDLGDETVWVHRSLVSVPQEEDQ